MQSFTELSLSAPIVRAITDLGFEKPSPIQAETLPILLGEPTDFLGLAATGTGKTAAFSIPMLERIEPKMKSVQALILCPTRELALQVAEQIDLLGKYKGVRSVPIYGGASYIDQIQGLKRGASVVVGTPGRIVDHLERGTLRLNDLKMLILDEADEMISMGFKDELEKILAAAPRSLDADPEADLDADPAAAHSANPSNSAAGQSANIWLFSATMSREVRRVADTYLRSPQQVQINRKEMLPSTIEQYYYPTVESNKPEVLCKLIEAADDFYGLVFCQTKSLVIDLTQYLTERGYKVDCLHGDKDQNSRERTMLAFRNRKVNVLVCTDVASRGLDVKDITHVINYSLPRELDNYVHRIGRTARSGKTGIAMNLVTFSHRRLISQIENMTKTRMLEGRLPTRREIGAKIVAKQLPKFSEQPFHARAVEVMSEEWKTALAGMSAEEVAGRFLTMLMPDIFNDREEKPAPRIDNRSEQRPARGFDRRGDRREDRRDDRRNDRRDGRHDGPRDEFRGGARRNRGEDNQFAGGEKPREERRPFGEKRERFSPEKRREDHGFKASEGGFRPFPRKDSGSDRRGEQRNERFSGNFSGHFSGKPEGKFAGKPGNYRTNDDRYQSERGGSQRFERASGRFSEGRPFRKSADFKPSTPAPKSNSNAENGARSLNRRERRALKFGPANAMSEQRPSHR